MRMHEWSCVHKGKCMNQAERFEVAPTVEQLMVEIEKDAKKSQSIVEKVALWCFRAMIGFASLAVAIAVIDKLNALPPELFKLVFSMVVAAIVIFFLLMCILICCMAIPLLSKTSAVYGRGLDERIRVERELTDKLRLIPAKELNRLADRVELESTLVMRRVGLGSVVVAVGAFVIGLSNKNWGTLNLPLPMDRGLVFVAAFVIGSSIGMLMLYTVSNRLDRVAHLLKDVAKSGTSG